jgi:hypothetical protein
MIDTWLWIILFPIIIPMKILWWIGGQILGTLDNFLVDRYLLKKTTK